MWGVRLGVRLGVNLTPLFWDLLYLTLVLNQVRIDAI